MDPRAPNLFVIGAPKAGTTFVHHALALAPDVHMTAVKEPGFFSSTRDFRLGLDYYLDAYFDGAAGHAVRGESTPWYLYSQEARERIASLPWTTPPQLLVLVRRPSTRAHSMFHDLRRSNREPRTFDVAISEELDDLERGRLHPDVRHRYAWCGRYTEHIVAWQEVFGSEHLQVVVFEDLVADPLATWRSLGCFLDHDLGPSRFGDVDERDRNPGGELRSRRLDALLRSLEGRNSAFIDTVKRRLPGRHRRVLQRIGRFNRTATAPPPVPSSEVMARVDEYCRPETTKLEQLIDHPLDAWKHPAGPSDQTRR